MSLKHRVLAINRHAIPDEDFSFVDRQDGKGIMIELWNEEKLGPRPTSIEDLPDGTREAEREFEDRTARKISETELELFEAIERLERGEAPQITDRTRRIFQKRKRFRQGN